MAVGDLVFVAGVVVGEHFAVVECLQDVVVPSTLFGVEQVFQRVGALLAVAGLVVNDTDAVALGRGEQVETVDDATEQMSFESGFVGFFLMENLPVSAFCFQFFCHFCIGFNLMSHEVLDDVAVDELCAVEGEFAVAIGAVVDSVAFRVCFWIVEKVDGKGVVEHLGQKGIVFPQCAYSLTVKRFSFVGLVEVVHGIVEDDAKHGLVHIVGHFVVGSQTFHIVEVELERTLHVGVDGRWREDFLLVEAGLEFCHHFVGLFHSDGRGDFRLAGSREGLELNLLSCTEEGIFFGEGLQHEARHLSFVASFGVVVIEQGDALGPLHEAVVIVGVEAHLLLDGCHVVGSAEGVWNERCAFVAFGHFAFVDRKHDDVAEVEVACFEQSHHLQSDGRFAVEGNGGLTHELKNEAHEHLAAEVERGMFFLQGVQTVHDGIGHKDALFVDLQGEVGISRRVLIAMPDQRDDVGEIGGEFLFGYRCEDALQNLVV